MTDSESDTSNNVFTFQNNTTVNAKGPNTNITNFSFRNPMTSTMYMSRNFERPRYAESAYDQRSMYSRRETSPMSIHSACDIRQRNFQQYANMSTRRSVFNGRSGSPMSMRSIDSSASVSAADIAYAFKNVKFNRNDLKVIRDAYQKLLKKRVRKRIEKRRNMRLLLRGSRRSGDDSGDQGSDSSVSSDDCRSVKTTYKENMSSSRSARMDLTDFRSYRDRNMLKDNSDNYGQNVFKNKFSVGSSSVIKPPQHFNNTGISNQFNSMPTQRDRFRTGFLLPSQRFNRSVAESVIMENTKKPHKSMGNNQLNGVRNHAQIDHNKNHCASGSEEEIFSEMTARETSTFNIESQRKRRLDEDESSLPNNKKSRITSPAKNSPKNKKPPPKLKNFNPPNVELSNSFQFAKPSLPVRKSKTKVQEQLIAKSAQPLTDFLESSPKTIHENVQVSQPTILQEKSNDSLSQVDQSEITQNSNVSSRPSFIKRKLFTQKLDVVEKANLSTDATNSPQSSVYSLQKEKNKARKLVTNQSCLNREVHEDNNLLDLIHKIVPPDRMNITNQTTINQTKSDVNNKNKKDNQDKWDVTSVISMCNEDDVSDTYTDEEIFEADNTIKPTVKSKDVNTKANPIDKVVNKVLIPNQDCKVMVKKLQSNNTLQKQVVNQNFSLTHNNVTKTNVTSSVKTFWDTDFESDAECQVVLPRIQIMDNLKTANTSLVTAKPGFKVPVDNPRSEFFKKPLETDVPKHLNNSLMNNTTFNSMRKLNTSMLSVRSHRTFKKKKCCNEISFNDTKSKLDNQIEKKRNNDKEQNEKTVEKNKTNQQSKNCTDTSKSKLNTHNENKSTNSRSTSQGKARSTSQSKKTPKEKKSNKDAQVGSPKNSNKKPEPKSKSENINIVNNKKSKTDTQSLPAVKNKAEKKNESTVKHDQKAKTHTDNQRNKKDLPKTTKGKPKPKSDRQNSSIQSKKKNPVQQLTNSNLNKTVEPVQNISFSGRPLRSCRTSSQSRSNELSGSLQLNNTSVEINKSLRSRVINLSSSIENITIKIKPKKKIINKNISQINTRKSDVSFSLGSKEQTPVAKKAQQRSTANFFKGKRKT